MQRDIVIAVADRGRDRDDFARGAGLGLSDRGADAGVISLAELPHHDPDAPPPTFGRWLSSNIGPLLAVGGLVVLILWKGLNIWDIMKVAMGLGLVIFIHELGHFLALRDDPARSWEECATALEALRAAEAIGRLVSRAQPDPASLPV